MADALLAVLLALLPRELVAFFAFLAGAPTWGTPVPNPERGLPPFLALLAAEPPAPLLPLACKVKRQSQRA